MQHPHWDTVLAGGLGHVHAVPRYQSLSKVMYALQNRLVAVTLGRQGLGLAKPPC
jgi:hypothetical protein